MLNDDDDCLLQIWYNGSRHNFIILDTRCVGYFVGMNTMVQGAEFGCNTNRGNQIISIPNLLVR